MDSSEVGKFWEENATAWTEQVRAGLDVYRDLVNTPAFLAMLPEVRGLSGLDLGCGEGANTRKLAERGAHMIGIDIAPTFIRSAAAFASAHPIKYEVCDAASLPFGDSGFDFATAFMSLMDMPNQVKALTEAYRVTKPGGFLQFSILHPCFVPSRRKTVRDGNGKVTAVLISDYFTETQGEIERWHFSALPEVRKANTPPFSVPHFHRTLASWIAYICKAGWIIEAFGEPRASDEVARLNAIVADTQIAPIFLIIRARRPLR